MVKIMNGRTEVWSGPAKYLTARIRRGALRNGWTINYLSGE
jgi:hypothetical protein